MIVVSDSSPLITLARIGRLALLADLFDKILVPSAVYDEVTVAGRGRPGAEESRRASWIESTKVDLAEHPEVARLCGGLGAGEAEAIALAASLRADLLLVDERKARNVAQSVGLALAGTIGLLEAGYRRGAVDDLRRAYVALLRQGIRVELKMLQNSLSRFGLPHL